MSIVTILLKGKFRQGLEYSKTLLSQTIMGSRETEISYKHDT